jgi:hypothetical protein
LVDANDAVEMIIEIETAALEAQARMVQARSATERAKAEQALEALSALKAIYEEIVGKEIEEEIAAEQQAGEFELPETPAETPGEEQGPEETEEKAFNFGAKLGERIRGGLFCGRGGKFASEADVGNIRSEMLSRLIARLRAKRGAGTGKKRGAAKKPKKGGGGKKPKKSPEEIARQKRAKQQAAMNAVFGAEGGLAEKMGMERNDIFPLERAVLDGEQMSAEDAERFIELGLVELDSDGEPLITSAGQALIKAASRGDVQKARQALERARRSVKPAEDEDEEKNKKKDLDGFTLNIRANIRGLWNGDFDQFDFVDGMISAIERGFDQAWSEGAAKCGIQPDERTPEEEIELRNVINEQFLHLPGFAADIDAGSKANGGALQPFLDRGDLWIGRYNEVVQRAQAMACADQKLKWELGEAEHCRSCLKLANKVKRASFWYSRGILPRQAGATYLECRGYKCDCRFTETDEPVSRGPLPRLP